MILFLDFDGVLHPKPRGNAEKFERLPLLDALLDEHPQVEIVLTTSWRQLHPLEGLKRMLSPATAARIVGATPIFPIGLYRETGSPVGPVREHECRTWLKVNNRGSQPWLAIDDDRSLFSASAPVVWCDPSTGLTESDMVQVIIYLEKITM